MYPLPQEPLPAGWRGELALTLRSVHPSCTDLAVSARGAAAKLTRHCPERSALSGASAPARFYRSRGTFL